MKKSSYYYFHLSLIKELVDMGDRSQSDKKCILVTWFVSCKRREREEEINKENTQRANALCVEGGEGRYLKDELLPLVSRLSYNFPTQVEKKKETALGWAVMGRGCSGDPANAPILLQLLIVVCCSSLAAYDVLKDDENVSYQTLINLILTRCYKYEAVFEDDAKNMTKGPQMPL
ncbi:hypothetical protein TNCV_4738201 [Trichonephila clavipes]|nr:hypothetical protein TNCV_4738201 [Trichonephila clavipes]